MSGVLDATHPFDRRSRDQLERPSSRKWSLHPGTIGAWVAEMDFGTAPVVTEALHRAIDDETLGYLSPADRRRDGSRHGRRGCGSEYGWDVDPERVHPVSDVMAALRVAVEEFSPAGSAVIVPTPAYMPFLTYLPRSGVRWWRCPGAVDDGRWPHDLDAIDAAFAAGARTLVLCNPHNPTGEVLAAHELEAIALIVERHGGRVFADEIHAPIRFGGRRHVPYASVSEAAAAALRHRHERLEGVEHPGPQGGAADHLERRRRAALPPLRLRRRARGVDPRRHRLDRRVRARRRVARERHPLPRGQPRDPRRRSCARELPGARFSAPDATYLGWIDVRELGIHGSPADFFRDRAGVALTDGALCGAGPTTTCGSSSRRPPPARGGRARDGRRDPGAEPVSRRPGMRARSRPVD